MDNPQILPDPKELTAPLPPEEAPAPAEDPSLESEIEALRAELLTLRAEKKAAEEAKEFAELFPGCDPAVIPPEVRTEVENGCPLTAAYALYLRRAEVMQAEAEAKSRLAGAKSAGMVSGSSGEGEYTLKEISAMTPSEVRRHYDDVIRSLAGYGKKRKS